MFRLIMMLLTSIAGLFVANEALNLSLVETVVAVILILGFLVLATGWTLRRSV
ncbi:hypothetical protein [Bradyrhizobium sp. NP1]|jgi:hypothetical protein|uniref:hypothetical protein n=1 Tax=Bradyrhizobium sp. NP1 TaxID=3049772 RepID=UPI0025A53FAA|nr:hypothetical protein [Bradyrhizobium sp. NP1]WJR80188.1 hypothetical protein QOU61_10645 [Bradyrhizobium sp. NP1]